MSAMLAVQQEGFRRQPKVIGFR